jgi:glucokinase
MAKKSKNNKLYLGVDVGGTKILAALVRESGKIAGRKRCSTPRTANPEETLTAVLDLAKDVLSAAGVDNDALAGIGVAVPGIVDSHQGRVAITPNMNLTGFPMGQRLRKAFSVPVALGNDVNLGTLGEQWLGAAALADSAVGIFVGTGIGGGIILDGHLIAGHRGAAGEVGHMRMHRDGPLCGCGARGCLEAFASRTAIERDIRQAVAVGRKTILTELIGPELGVIRSSMLKRALAENDPLVKEIMGRAAETLGVACLQIRHLFDPEVIILGGGVVEACPSFILPIVQQAIASDRMANALPGGKVVVSALGDDAVVLGAVALVQQQTGHDPIRKARHKLANYPTLSLTEAGQLSVDGDVYAEDVYLRVDAKVNKRAKALRKAGIEASPNVGAAELKVVCKGKPSVLVVGTGQNGQFVVTDEGRQFLHKRRITCEMLPTVGAMAAYNALKGSKAALIHVG